MYLKVSPILSLNILKTEMFMHMKTDNDSLLGFIFLFQKKKKEGRSRY